MLGVGEREGLGVHAYCLHLCKEREQVDSPGSWESKFKRQNAGYQNELRMRTTEAYMCDLVSFKEWDGFR